MAQDRLGKADKSDVSDTGELYPLKEMRLFVRSVRGVRCELVNAIPKGGRTRTDKIGVGAGTDIVFPTSKTHVCRTHRPTKSLSAPARQSVL